LQSVNGIAFAAGIGLNQNGYWFHGHGGIGKTFKFFEPELAEQNSLPQL